jgi:hypothetical protein
VLSYKFIIGLALAAVTVLLLWIGFMCGSELSASTVEAEHQQVVEITNQLIELQDKYIALKNIYYAEINNEGWILVIDGQMVVVNEAEVREYIEEMLNERLNSGRHY